MPVRVSPAAVTSAARSSTVCRQTPCPGPMGTVNMPLARYGGWARSFVTRTVLTVDPVEVTAILN